jgi:hypothetical protein
MNFKKINNIFIALFLTVSIFACGLIGEACLCGQACANGIQSGSSSKIFNSLFHNRCIGSICKSCNYENGLSIKITKATKPLLKLKIFDTHFIISGSDTYNGSGNIHIAPGSFRLNYQISAVPIYLKNNCLLC